MANAQLCETVTDILNRSVITENLLVLPEGQLERKLYEKVAKAIQLAGGKWNRSKDGFIFSSDPRTKLGLALMTKVVVDEKKLRQEFYTPKKVAEEVALFANVEGKSVLEPSAGKGSLVFACLDKGASHVTAVEINSECAEDLSGTDITVEICDFLEMKPKPEFDRVVMNPPYSKNQDIKHITNAMQFLKPDGNLFAIVLDHCPKLDDLFVLSVLARFGRGAFKESGTSVATKLVRISKYNNP